MSYLLCSLTPLWRENIKYEIKTASIFLLHSFIIHNHSVMDSKEDWERRFHPKKTEIEAGIYPVWDHRLSQGIIHTLSHLVVGKSGNNKRRTLSLNSGLSLELRDGNITLCESTPKWITFQGELKCFIPSIPYQVYQQIDMLIFFSGGQ